MHNYCFNVKCVLYWYQIRVNAHSLILLRSSRGHHTIKHTHTTGTEITCLIAYSNLLPSSASVYTATIRAEMIKTSHYLTVADVDLSLLSVPVICNLCNLWSTVASSWLRLIALFLLPSVALSGRVSWNAQPIYINDFLWRGLYIMQQRA